MILIGVKSFLRGSTLSGKVHQSCHAPWLVCAHFSTLRLTFDRRETKRDVVYAAKLTIALCPVLTQQLLLKKWGAVWPFHYANERNRGVKGR